MLSSVKALALAFFAALLVAACGQSPETTIAGAKEAWNNKDFQSAIIQLKAVLQSEPDNMQARWLLGQIYLDAEDGASSEKELRRARELGVNDDSTVPALAQALLLQNKFDDILRLEYTENLSPVSLAELNASRALAHLANEQPEEAETAMTAALSGAPASPKVQLAHARYLVARGDRDAARGLLDELLQNDQANGPAWSLRAALYEDSGDYADAEQAYSKAIEYRLVNIKEILRRGLIRSAGGDLQGAAEDAARLGKLAPDAHMSHYLRGLVLYAQEDFPGAEGALENAYSRDSSHIQTIYLLASTQVLRGNAERARTLAESIVNIQPGYIPGRKLLAAIRLDDGEAEDAEQLLNPVAVANPDDAKALELLAASLIQQNKIAEASELLNRLADANQGQPKRQAVAGVVMLAAGKQEQGLAALRAAVERAPAERDVNVITVASLLRAKMADAALDAARVYSENNPSDPVAWNMLGAAWLAQGQSDEASKAFRKALALDPGNPAASDKLAVISAVNNDFESARRYLDTAIAEYPDNAQVLYRQSQLDFWDKDAAPSEESLERAVEADPRAVKPRVALARLRLTKNEPVQALEVLPGRGGSDSTVLWTRAAAHIALRQYQDAKVELEALRIIEPRKVAVHLLLARIYAELEEPTALRASLDRALAINPKHRQATLVKARLLVLEGRFDEADRMLADLEQQINKRDIAETRLFLARARRDPEAELAAARFLHEEKDTSSTVLALAQAQERVGQREKAVSLLLEWLREHPRDVAVLQFLSQLHLRAGETVLAVESLERLLALGPDNVVALNNLAWVVRETNPQLALSYAKRAYGQAPQLQTVLDTYADVLARNGQRDKALLMIDQAIEASDREPTMRLRRAEILKLAGDRSQAVRSVQLLLNDDLPAQVREKAESLLANWDR